MCTTYRNRKEREFCPQTVFMRLLWFSEHKAIIYPKSFNWLFIIKDTDCVLCEVEAGFV
jgi:hypothetical protein